ncbi:hypothetical protein ACFCXP_29515 [Streptomyces niveus]|uniref:hypothetical protein n=1 Tax=Streptomyces niveus TaxID=193462 RepID=UPI0035E3A95E
MSARGAALRRAVEHLLVTDEERRRMTAVAPKPQPSGERVAAILFTDPASLKKV